MLLNNEYNGYVLKGKSENALHYLILINLAYLLKESRETIKYEDPQYGNPNLGFAITVFRVDHKFYDYTDQCLRLMGKKPVRECGVTMSVSFNTPEENNSFRDNFKLRMDQGEELLVGLGDRTPQEHYFLKTKPIIKSIEDTPNNHFIFLLADDVDRQVLGEVLGDHDVVDMGDAKVQIKVLCYRKKWRDKMVRYLSNLIPDSLDFD